MKGSVIKTLSYDLSSCRLCPRKCGADRTETVGVCGCGSRVKLAKVSLHMWEEPVISGKNGSGTVFFSGCSLKCVYCQNYKISHEAFGKEISVRRLAEIFLEQQDRGAHNINLVSGAHFAPQIISALDMVRHRLFIPVVYNSGGYENVSTLRLLDGYIDIYLPDIKYFSSQLSKKYSAAESYFECASKAVLEMHRQQPALIYGDDGMLKRGLIIRHMVLPHCRRDSMSIVRYIGETFPKGSYLLSLMSQYTPYFTAEKYTEINRRITSFEYKSVLSLAQEYGMEGFFQERRSAKEEYIPDFDLTGV